MSACILAKVCYLNVLWPRGFITGILASCIPVLADSDTYYDELNVLTNADGRIGCHMLEIRGTYFDQPETHCRNFSEPDFQRSCWCAR